MIHKITLYFSRMFNKKCPICGSKKTNTVGYSLTNTWVINGVGRECEDCKKIWFTLN